MFDSGCLSVCDQIGIWSTAITPANPDNFCDASSSMLTNAVAYYRADSGEGRTLVDETGNYHATLLGSTMWVPVSQNNLHVLLAVSSIHVQ